MAIVRDEAIVLKRTALRETSLMVTAFSRRSGKVKLVFKGIRKQKSDRLAACEPFTRVSVVYYEKIRSGLHLGSDIAILEAYPRLKQELRRFAFASYLAELMAALFEPQDAQEDVFELLAETFRLMEEAAPEKLARIFEIKILERIGLFPVLDRCVVCGSENLEKTYFSPAQGGILCPRCDRKESRTIPIASRTLEALYFFKTSSIRLSAEFEIDHQTLRSLARIGESYLTHHLSFALKSSKFISDLGSLLKKQAFFI